MKYEIKEISESGLIRRCYKEFTTLRQVKIFASRNRKSSDTTLRISMKILSKGLKFHSGTDSYYNFICEKRNRWGKSSKILPEVIYVNCNYK